MLRPVMLARARAVTAAAAGRAASRTTAARGLMMMAAGGDGGGSDKVVMAEDYKVRLGLAECALDSLIQPTRSRIFLTLA